MNILNKHINTRATLSIISACMLGGVVASCASDDGNYDYHDVNELTISGIEKQYTVEQFSQLSIKPEIKGSISYDESEYDFLWYVYKEQARAGEKADTLARTCNLDVEVSKAPGSDYRLVFEALNRNTGRRAMSIADFSVINSYSDGLAILSDVEGMSQVSFINSLGKVTEDAYELVNGRKAGRGPIGIFLAGRNSNSDQMIVVSTEDSAFCCNNIDFTYKMNYSKLFFFPSTPGRLEGVLHGNGNDEYVVVDGKVYTRTIFVWSGAADTCPKFPASVPFRNRMLPFNFFNDNATVYFYDPVERCFLFVDWNQPVRVSEGYGTSVWDANNVGMDMLWGVSVPNSDGHGRIRCVMKADNGDCYILSGMKDGGFDWETFQQWLFINSTGKLKVGSDIANSSSFALSSLDPDFLYYTTGSKVMCISALTGNTISETSVSGGNVDFMKFDPTDNTKLYVGVSDGSKKAKSGSLHVFKMESNGQLTLQATYANIFGKIVDLDTNTSRK